MKKPLNTWFLFILPALLFLTGILFLHSSGTYFLSCVDPEYAYLFNGALFADLKLRIAYILHPGTPLIVLIALVIRVVHAFRPAEAMLADVISNPELYIQATIYTINLLSAGMLLLLGFITYRRTRNIRLALFLQLIPFVHSLGMETLARVIPESLMLSLLCLWIIQIINMYADKESMPHKKMQGLSLGILYGLSVALKLTLLPFAVVPLIILSGWKSRLTFILVSVLSFVVFAFPVFLKYNLFKKWVTNIIWHTGTYGTGDSGIWHWNEFLVHLKLLAGNSQFLIVSLGLLMTGLMAYSIPGKDGKRGDRLIFRLSVSMILVVALQFMITAKHFAYHYMLPAILLTVPMLLLSGNMLREKFPSLLSSVRLKAVMAVSGILILGIMIRGSYHQISRRLEKNKVLEASYNQFKKYRSSGPLIVSASYNGCPPVEYALTFGIQESGRYTHYLYEKVTRIYPSTILYFPWGKVFYAGHDEIAPSAFLKERTNYMLYIAEYSQKKLEEITGYLDQNDKGLHFTARNIYYIQSTNEALFELVAREDVTKNDQN